MHAAQDVVFVESPSNDPFFNLALEQYLFERADPEVLYFYLWQNHNTIVVGRFQNTAGEINLPFVREAGISVVRRLSGGGAVYHDLGNLNFSFIAGAQNAGLDLAFFADAVAGALRQMGAPAKLSGRNDITLAGKKFSGNAQYIKNKKLLHHGTLLFDSNLQTLSKALNAAPDKIASKGIKSVKSRVTNIKPYLPAAAQLEDFKAGILKGMFGDKTLKLLELGASDFAAVQTIADERYQSWEWNFGASPPYEINKRRRIEGVGAIELSLRVEKGLITGFYSSGDYFGSDERAGLEAALAGCRPNYEDVLAATAHIDIGHYYLNLSREDFARLVAE